MLEGLNGEMVSAKLGKKKGYVYLDAVLNYMDKMSGVLMTVKSRTVTLMGRIYSVSYINQASEFNNYTAERDEFLNSLDIVAKDRNQPSNGFYGSEAKTTGEMIWRMFIAIFIILCITIVAIYFGTRKSKAERANQVKDL